MNIHHTFMIHSSLVGHLDCFCFFSIMKRTSMTMADKVSSEYIPMSAIAGPYGTF